MKNMIFENVVRHLMLVAFFSLFTCLFCTTEKVDAMTYTGDAIALNEVFNRPSTEYSSELAYFAAGLSALSESFKPNDLETRYKALGITKHHSYNYANNKWGIDEGSLACSFATVELADGSDLLIVVARGSTTIGEFIGDSLTVGKEDFYGYYVNKHIYNFQKEIRDRLDDFLDENEELLYTKKLKILVTGHSYGGAAANLVGMNFTKFADAGAWWSGRTSKNDIYCYTFGAINSLSENKTISSGFENIHNVYNTLDGFGPSRKGYVMLNGLGDGFGKFGHMDLYTKEHSTASDPTKDTINHDIYKYAEDIENNLVQPCNLPIGKTFASGKCGTNANWSLVQLANGSELKISGTGEIYDYQYSDFTPWTSRVRRLKATPPIKIITIQEGITCIGRNDFAGLLGVTTIKLPNSLTRIGDSAFAACRSIKNIAFPKNLKYIGGDAFGDCSGLEKISIPKGIKKIEGGTFSFCTSLKSVTIPKNITEIGKQAFSSCFKLKKVVISGSVKKIGFCAFQLCYSLKAVVLKSGIKELEDSVFSGCKKLKSITVPKSVKKIGDGALGYCKKIYGYKNSAAQKYAKKHKIKFVNIGKNSKKTGGKSKSNKTKKKTSKKAKKKTKTSKIRFYYKPLTYIGMTYGQLKKKEPKTKYYHDAGALFYSSIMNNKLDLCFWANGEGGWSPQDSDKSMRVEGKLNRVVSGMKKTMSVKSLAKKLKAPKGFATKKKAQYKYQTGDEMSHYVFAGKYVEFSLSCADKKYGSKIKSISMKVDITKKNKIRPNARVWVSCSK